MTAGTHVIKLELDDTDFRAKTEAMIGRLEHLRSLMPIPFVDELRAIAEMVHREADTGAPGGMVATYAELALRHLAAGHVDAWSDCDPCHRALGSDEWGAK